MKYYFLIDFRLIPTEDGGRRCAVASGYIPTWRGDNKEQHNGAMLFLSGNNTELFPGESDICLIQPVCPEEWTALKISDKIDAYEGLKKVGDAVILNIFSFIGRR